MRDENPAELSCSCRSRLQADKPSSKPCLLRISVRLKPDLQIAKARPTPTLTVGRVFRATYQPKGMTHMDNHQ